MSRSSHLNVVAGLLIVCFFNRCPTAVAGVLTTGDILVNDRTDQPGGDGRIREFTAAGELVQTFTFPQAPGDGQPRSVAVDGNGNIQIYNGTFTPYLTTINAAAGSVTRNITLAGWSTINNGTYGGLGAFGNYVFATDTATAGAGTPNGIIRFGVNDSSALRFASGTDYIQLAIGKDGLLYGQSPATSPGGNLLDVYNPNTLSLIRQITLPQRQDLRSIAVDKSGNIFAVDYNDTRILEYDRNGNLIHSLDTGLFNLINISLDSKGRLITAGFDLSFDNVLVVADTSLSGLSEYILGSSLNQEFVAFVEPPVNSVVPEPSSLLLAGIAAATLAAASRRRRSGRSQAAHRNKRLNTRQAKLT